MTRMTASNVKIPTKNKSEITSKVSKALLCNRTARHIFPVKISQQHKYTLKIGVYVSFGLSLIIIIIIIIIYYYYLLFIIISLFCLKTKKELDYDVLRPFVLCLQ
ncbi:hypothetical protein RFI_11109 [Reticulomyxa filosa]|uniref:Uncharacterized protein n=1 Tax=Reticulomyxa filosa TaxID=46433 RepID=X6NJD5_RETFI|nr:hypothetical protein RFI_11109 [Reticulomyxa filosa]|eukprot:ETO26028.1 hypothetical protein RFI_11109 [Reticulomyxa filosa]